MRSLRALFGATHPEASVVVTTAMVALGASAGLGWRTVLLGAAVLSGQFSIGWSNDWLDRHRDRAAGRDDKPLVTGAVADATVWSASLVAVVLCAVLSFALDLAAGLAHLTAVGFGWAYNLDLKFRAISVVPYAGAFGLLPLVVGLAAPEGVTTPGWLMAASACLGAGAHFAQVVPDLAVDAHQGVRGLPQRLGAGGSLVAAAVLLGAAGVLVAIRPGRDLTVGGLTGLFVLLLGVAAVVVAGITGRPRLGFRITLLVALGVVVLLVSGGSPYRPG